MERIRKLLKLAGKGDAKVVAVFSVSAEACVRAVRHVRAGTPEIPIWLFCTEPPPAEAAKFCERIWVDPNSLALLIAAEKALWPRWVALGVTAWTGVRGRWPVKFAPWLVPPFRVLVLNEQGDFFSGSPAAIVIHAKRRLRDTAHSGWNRAKDLHRGAWLAAFAVVAQWFSPMSRYAFRRVHGSRPRPIACPPPVAQRNWVEFRYGHRHWDRDALIRLLDESRARWILFLEARAAPDVRPWLTLFDDSRTLAVSLQVTYREWRSALFTVAPFRTLQPGEASQTLAPVSPVMLVDREKLRVLGVPQTIVPGSAWYLLFWRAAAAGWRAYSAGSTEVVEEAADWPYEEAEFVTRVLRDSDLRTLGPAEPELARGSIAFSLTHPRVERTRCRVLVVSPYLPWPLSHGGAVRIWNLCRELAPRVDFVLAAFREKSDRVDYEKLHEVFREVYVVDRDEKPSGDRSLPAQVREHRSTAMEALLRKILRERRVDALQIEFTHLAHFREAAPDTPAILVEHDLTFTLYRQFAERDGSRAAWEEYQRWLSFERGCFQRFEAIWTMSDEDRSSAIAEGSDPHRTLAIANGVDLRRFVPGGRPAEPPEILFVGSFRHLPNLLGFDRLCTEVMPRVWARFPQARLRVVAGPDPERYWQDFLKRPFPSRFDPRIELHAFVADVLPLYQQASVVAVPLLVSAGTNIKVMEAMACEKPVVSTPIGCHGLDLIDGWDALIRESSEAFADAIVELLADGRLREQIGLQGRATVEARFSWESIADAAYGSYERIMARAVP